MLPESSTWNKMQKGSKRDDRQLQATIWYNKGKCSECVSMEEGNFVLLNKLQIELLLYKTFLLINSNNFNFNWLIIKTLK